MRDLSPAFAAHLNGAATTLCRCWKLVRRDGVVLGFTDHDRDLAFGGVTFRAATGLDAAEATAELGFAVGGGDVSGALSAASLTEDDLVGGRYDDAAIEVWLVNWQDPQERLLFDAGTIGEVRRTDTAFFAEIRSLAHRLDEERGRVYAATCAADLGDATCRVALASPAFTATATVVATDGRLSLTSAGLAAFPARFFAQGRLVWQGGAKAGLVGSVKAHTQAGGLATLTLWQPLAIPIEPDDAFSVSAGCDKNFDTCRLKFGNGLNFRGFPHIPGSDVLVRYARIGDGDLDGGSLFR